MRRLAAQYADYWNDLGVDRAENLAPAREAVDAACSKVGREPATLQRTSVMLIDLPGAYKGPFADQLRQYRSRLASNFNTPEELAELLRAFAREGVSHVHLWLEPNTLAAIDAVVPVLKLLDQDS
jgi:alkanesulfonate monooxygenase SsuD/methylene tetrahydromethanopterin reductase-like flavin-dependent oxidoreductase (luciferase family)